ncbi:ABC1 kinase family protein [Candidatus Nanosalina sp. VS9-1]|uniref:ABC1 kinase family protein n=1 Tax=Candidatus Nanosalina sp. VS9-1 TaxID=3388566 RepID=UPI0039E18E1C
MGRVENEVSDIKRLDEIIHIMADQELGIVLDKLDLTHRLPFTKRFTSDRQKKPKPERLRETFEELGPTFVKLGQIMAQRPDIVPRRYIEELEGLEDSVSPFDSEEAVDIVEEEIGPLDDNFDEFDEEPMAAASIAQVHSATLPDGEDVVVKVRRPGIKEKVHRDLDIIEFLAKRAENVSSRLSGMQLVDLVKEFDKWIREEMDLQQEGRNADIIRQNMSDNDRVKIPEVYSQYTTEKVLVMEEVGGVKCTDTEALEDLNIDTAELTRRGIKMGLNQVIRDGFFHADPHPSNFFIGEDGSIILIDFGMVGKLTKSTRERLGVLLLHISNEDVDSAFEVIKELGHVAPDADTDAFKQDIEELVLTLRNARVKDQSMTSTLFKMIVKASRRGVYLPTNLVLTGKTLVTIEGILLTINPEAQLTDDYRDQVEDILKKENSPKELGKTFMIDFYQNKELLTKAPSKIAKLLEDQEQKNVQVQQHSEDHEEILITGLILSAVFLFAQTMPSNTLQLIGGGLLVFALWLFID